MWWGNPTVIQTTQRTILFISHGHQNAVVWQLVRSQIEARDLVVTELVLEVDNRCPCPSAGGHHTWVKLSSQAFFLIFLWKRFAEFFQTTAFFSAAVFFTEAPPVSSSSPDKKYKCIPFLPLFWMFWIFSVLIFFLLFSFLALFCIVLQISRGYRIFFGCILPMLFWHVFVFWGHFWSSNFKFFSTANVCVPPAFAEHPAIFFGKVVYFHFVLIQTQWFTLTKEYNGISQKCKVQFSVEFQSYFRPPLNIEWRRLNFLQADGWIGVPLSFAHNIYSTFILEFLLITKCKVPTRTNRTCGLHYRIPGGGAFGTHTGSATFAPRDTTSQWLWGERSLRSLPLASNPLVQGMPLSRALCWQIRGVRALRFHTSRDFLL